MPLHTLFTLLLPILVLGLFNQQKLMRPNENFRQGFNGAHATAQGSESKKQVPLPASREEVLGSLNGITTRVNPWVRQEV